MHCDIVGAVANVSVVKPVSIFGIRNNKFIILETSIITYRYIFVNLLLGYLKDDNKIHKLSPEMFKRPPATNSIDNYSSGCCHYH